jgi:alkylated DNA repair dioxygenase AlkB
VNHLAIEGLTLVKNFIPRHTAKSLLDEIDTQPWMMDLRRRVQHYGFKYDYKRRQIDPDIQTGDFPNWACGLATQLVAEGVFDQMPDQCIVNEYVPGQGIGAHVDCEPCFGDVIASVSLNSACVMDFTHVENNRKVSVPLMPNSLLIMRGEARYQWRHGIASRKTDRIYGVLLQRNRRVSVTFRKVIVKDHQSNH